MKPGARWSSRGIRLPVWKAEPVGYAIIEEPAMDVIDPIRRRPVRRRLRPFFAVRATSCPFGGFRLGAPWATWSVTR